MGEKEIINLTNKPNTVSSMVKVLRRLGVRKGDILLVHSSLSMLGWVCGGPQAVILALQQTVGDKGTVVMPTHSGDWSDPAEWAHPPVPEDWIPIIRDHMPPYDPKMTPTRGVGILPECFRSFPRRHSFGSSPGLLRIMGQSFRGRDRGPSADAPDGNGLAPW